MLFDTTLHAGENIVADSSSSTTTVSRVDSLSWNWITYAYCVYFGVVFVGNIAGTKTNSLGALLFLCLLCGRYWTYFFSAKADALYVWVVLSMLLPIVPMISYDERMFSETFQELVNICGTARESNANQLL